MSKFGLGKGLGALIPEHQQYYDAAKNPGDIGDSITIVPLSHLKPNPEQPRKTFPEGSIEELADSIRKHGLLQPIIAESAGDGEFVIIAGERRFRAASRAGLTEVPVIVRSVSSEKRLQLSLIENIQREDLNPMEEAKAYSGLMELTGYTQEQVAEAVGKNRSTVANALRMLRLSDAMQTAVRDGTISAGHARSLLAVSDERKREALFARVVAEGLSVRQVEMAVQELSGYGGGKKAGKGRKSQKGASADDALEPDLRAICEQLIGLFGTKVEIRGDMKSGSITIDYYSQDDLQRILDLVGEGT
ncbi:MAG TPA: ParB/RepB/Spo0J family partition protein [Rectinemataceae bacterium]|nr:ParB/RepB/Spo0J family partition protein [Rectinemataceae bacterium]